MTGNTAVIQARMGSARFPGKMTASLGPHTILEWVLTRVKRSYRLDEVILATSDQAPDRVLVEIAERCHTPVYRGSEHDVLGRFVGAARTSKGGNIIRVCGDNPFVDPDEIDRLAQFFSENRCDYACNHRNCLGSNYADGFGAEILSAELLYRIDAAAVEPSHREHVTSYLYDRSQQYCLRAVPAPDGLAFPGLRFDVDTPSDLSRLQDLVEMGINIRAQAPEIIQAALNADHAG